MHMEQITPISEEQKNIAREGSTKTHHIKNLYPAARHTLLIICVLCALFLIIYLINQNGKSIYENGV